MDAQHQERENDVPMEIIGIQNEIAKVLDKMDETTDVVTEKDAADHLRNNIRKLRDIVISLGTKFSGELLSIADSREIAFSELFKEGEFEREKAVSSGAFGKVYIREFRGQKVAVKIQEIGKANFQEEIKIMRTISHDNIISFRGWGKHCENIFLVMEYLNQTLHQYVKDQIFDDHQNLSSRITWAISKQIAQAMHYLHNLKVPIAHGDLKPDNILLDTALIIPKPKLCDFGLSRDYYNPEQDEQISEDETAKGDELTKEKIKRGHKRYLVRKKEWTKATSMDDLLKFDVFAFGLVVLYMRTGKIPYHDEGTAELEAKGGSYPLLSEDGKYYIRDVPLPDLPATDLGSLILKSCGNSADRPTFKAIMSDFFPKQRNNPFNLPEKAKFFECGFLKDTEIFVADSLVEDISPQENYVPSSQPPGYRRENLVCAVEIQNKPYHDKPEEEKLCIEYSKHYSHFCKMAEEKKIDDNPAVALAALIMDGEGKNGSQKVELRYKEKTYCHHRAMREIWRSFEVGEKNKQLPFLSVVHPLYSTSFGLHVAILTNEGPGKTKKFVFTQRSTKPGVASPGSFTCGAVESCSVKDYLAPEKAKKIVPDADSEKAYVSLVDTAARGLEEELGLPLYGTDKDAITLNTIYLKFDNHEWGMCGFVDLTSEKIREENRFSFEKLYGAFTTGPKDKFEHWQIHGVDFELRNMVEWIRENHDKLASSAKIAVVKVLQAFFGAAKVEEEFSKKM